jgi:tetratricopeptide (TPR) repeat protein
MMRTESAQRRLHVADVETRPRWIHGAAADLLIGCGAWTAPLLVLTYVVSIRRLFDLALVFYVLMLFCNNPHYMATIERAYGTRADFRKYRLFTVYATLLLVAVGALVHFVPAGLPWIVTLYLAWSPWHYTGQNFGLAMLWVRRNGAEPTRTERDVLSVAFLASYLMWLLWMQSTDSTDANVLSLGIPSAVTTPLRLALLGVFALGGTWTMVRLARRSGARAMSAAIVLLSTQLLWFVVPTMVDLYWRQPLPPAYYTGGVLAFMHCAQYLWITTYYARRETEAGSRGAGGRWDGRRYYLLLVFGGIALFIPGPWLISSLFTHDLTDSLLIFAALVNIHHFILDGAIWKLRDGRVARLLLGSPVAAADSHSARDDKLDQAWEWLRGVSRSRLARAAAIAAVIGCALIDQVQYVLTADSTTAGQLAAASKLNRHDTRVLVRDATLLANAGNAPDAIAELERAIALNPRHASALRMLGSLLVQTGRYQDAAVHYQKVEQVVRPDLTTLINTAVLAAQAGDPQRAEERLLLALRIDPDHPEAHLDLAEVYFANGIFDRAIPHYRDYLDLTAQSGMTDPRLQLRTAVLRKLAEAHSRVGEEDAARALIEEAQALEGHARLEAGAVR